MVALRCWLLVPLLCASGAVAIAADGNRCILVRGSICDRETDQGVGGVELVLSNWAVELLQRLPEEDAKARGQNYFQLAWLASFRPETRIPAVVRNYNWLWLPGEPDNAFQSEF